MNERVINEKERTSRRALGVHLTSIDIFLDYIFPEINNILENYIWADLYCGEGNLILPMLNFIPEEKRIPFFEEQIYLFDVQEDMVDKCIENAISYNIPREIAEKNIVKRDNLKSFPIELKKKNLSIFHITNPPYLYLGYIRKHKKTERHLKYFINENEGYQDLYQIAMINDLRNNIKNLIYIIPSNFLFGSAVSNKFRIDFLPYYEINKMFIFETKVFEFTGTNICISFFKRKVNPRTEKLEFNGVKILKKNKTIKRKYILKPKWKYRAGAKFDDFAEKYKAIKPLAVKYYLLNDDVKKNAGSNSIKVIDTNAYISNDYKREILHINEQLRNKILTNILYVRTVDTGSREGRAGLNIIRDDFDVDGIFVSKATYRTSPIQIFLNPMISIEDQNLLKNYFNCLLEHFRTKLDSEFMTTYKYSNADYTRKYLGLTQVRKIIGTFPILNLTHKSRLEFIKIIETKKTNELLEFLSDEKSAHNEKRKLDLTSWL